MPCGFIPAAIESISPTTSSFCCTDNPNRELNDIVLEGSSDYLLQDSWVEWLADNTIVSLRADSDDSGPVNTRVATWVSLE